ncbi:MAG: hypothetical protein DRJ15_11115 [Bacteroidetes bacterium]|nr:MAG: hypothetical protein DRJ15_11115 [Bacteroidota bacterium]
MKKVFITLLVLTFTASVFAQQVDRERVVLEIGTGTWCGYCPGAAMGADDLVANGCDVAVIEYHSGDSFANTASNARISYYGISGFPTAKFDGVLQYVGGSATQSMYNNYLPLYNQRIVIPCNYTATIYGQNNGLNYDVTVIVDLEDGTPPTDLTAHLVLTESEIPFNWQGMSELNYVCRAMYPDHSGTTVDFAGGDQVIINYNFTLDAGWDASHVELVTFMQEESSKEVLQGTMVPILDIFPLEASANFSCNNQLPCETTSVDFYDESMGIITSWLWTFEGGTPATSTEENPTVTYNTPGVYDVQLYVEDASVNSTMLKEDYIEVITAPGQAGTPTGPSDLCDGGTGYNYNTTAPSGPVSSYTWEIDPASAGTIMGTSTVATLDVNPAYTGTIDITVRADNQCGDGIWSDAFQATAHTTPSTFWISDGGSYCVGTPGVEVALDGSESGVDYELLLDGVATGTIVAGTGSAISFGNQTDEGIYIVFAFTDYCDINMYGNAYIYPIDVPGQAATPNGDAAVCIGETNEYSTDGAQDAETYIWTLDPEEAGLITGTTVNASVEWSAAYTGEATIAVQGINDCGDGLVSDPFTATVNALPEPEITGDEYVYENTPGYTYSSPDHASAGYAWTVTGGTITNGQGTNEITITWGSIGTGYVNLTETSAAECEGIAVELVVYIQPLAINESFMNEISLYPNPAGESLNIELYSQKDANISLQVINQTGQLMLDKTETLATGNNKTSLNTSGLPNGYYTLKLIAEDGTVVQQKFIIMK